MKTNKEDNLKKLLKQAGTDQASGDFTDAVMNMIAADAVQEKALKSLLKQHAAEGPSFNFTAQVMAQVGPKQKVTVFQPIIPKKAWYAVAAMLCLFLILIGVAKPDTPHKDNIGTSISALVQHIATIPTAYAVAAAIAAGLFLADYFFTSRNEKSIIG